MNEYSIKYDDGLVWMGQNIWKSIKEEVYLDEKQIKKRSITFGRRWMWVLGA